ncbi:DUF2381 family protein [Archangium violaceum]|nr:DUF2381 family protein [Archangium violaceum]
MTLALLAGTTEATESPRVFECSASSRIDLMAEPTELVHGVCVNPDEPTTFVFDALLPSEAVVLFDNRSVDFAQGGAFVTVYPKRSFLPGERVKLSVSFRDGSSPENATFWLVGHSARGARRVEVFRHAHSADALQRDATAARAEANQCQEEKARLLAERMEPGGLMGAAWLERTGEIQSKDIFNDLKQYSNNTLTVEAAKSYSHTGGVAVRLKFLNPGTELWVAVKVILKSSKGTEVEFSAWQKAAINPGDIGSVVVGIARAQEQLGCPCTLTLMDAQEMRTITLGNITFPASQSIGH